MPLNIKSVLKNLSSVRPSGNILGVDFGSSSVKIAALKKTGESFQLAHCGIVPMPSGAKALMEMEMEERAELVKRLKDFLSSAKVRTKPAGVSVMGSSVIVRYVKLPKMPDDELAKSLRFEAEEFIPFDISDVYLAAELIKDVEEEGQVKAESVLVAAKKEIVDERIELLKNIGLDPVMVDVDSFCVNNVYEYCFPAYRDENVMILNIGANMTTLSISDHGAVRVVRDVSFGGGSLSKLVMSAFACDFPKAEALKRQYGIVPSTELETMSEAETAEQVTSALIQSVDDQLLTEIQRSVDYFNTISTASEGIKKIVLSGGGANLKNLDKYLARQIDIPVEIFNPLDFINHPDDAALAENAAAFAVALGLAMRQAGDSKSIRAV
ncbi:MAG: type IV pilus assembly protein PilM [bacterium]